MKIKKIAIIGLGYVGLPLAIEFAKKYEVIGFDLNEQRIQSLQNGIDETLEVSKEELIKSNLYLTSKKHQIAQSNIFIITVPTPINENNQPDLSPLIKASTTIGSVLKKNDLVIYESTVYPGVTEEECVPILQEASGLNFNEDFFVGYSPERINPGDKDHRLTDILKITSGSNPEIANKVDALYNSIITAGTFKASTIKVAEAAKVIENTQRDVNIALINELAIIFNKLNIDTEEVLKAAGTKWNFQPFRPGLVGGHCIGVDPYYLTHKAQSVGYHPEIILAGRRLNDGMGAYVSSMLIKEMLKKGINIKTAKVLILGLTFKENCPDIRNTKIVDVISELEQCGVDVDCYDPWIEPHQIPENFNINIISNPKKRMYDGIVLSVAHDKFKEMGVKKISEYGKDNSILYDLKYIFYADQVNLRL